MEISYSELITCIDDFDLEGFLQDYGFEPTRARGGIEWIGDCPECGKTGKLAVDVDKKAFHCWVCQEYENKWDSESGMFKTVPVKGAGGLIALVALLESIDKSEAAQLIYDSWASAELTALPEIKEISLKGPVNGVQAPYGSAPITQLCPFMVERGITLDDVKSFGLFWCSTGFYQNRIVFPVWESGNLVYWQARAMWKKEDHPFGTKYIKSLNPPASQGGGVSSDFLFNIEQAAQYPRVVITEGPIDAIHVGPSAVCCFGKRIYPNQVRKLLDYGVRAIDLMWDGPSPTEPKGAHPDMIDVAPWLASFFDVRLVFLPQGDPGDWSRTDLAHFLAHATPAQYADPMAAL